MEAEALPIIYYPRRGLNWNERHETCPCFPSIPQIMQDLGTCNKNINRKKQTWKKHDIIVARFLLIQLFIWIFRVVFPYNEKNNNNDTKKKTTKPNNKKTKYSSKNNKIITRVKKQQRAKKVSLSNLISVTFSLYRLF